jgi:hypothetical protein
MSIPWGQRTRQVCRYECQDCRATIDYPPPGKTFVKAVDVHRKFLTAKGWKLNGHADRATCPNCRQSQKVVADAAMVISPPEPTAEAPPAVLQAPIAAPPPAIKAAAEQPAKRGRPKKSAVVLPPWPIATPDESSPPPPAAKAKSAKTNPPPAPTIPPLFLLPQPERPTDEQRLKIRFQLDHHFDDNTGCYLGYQTDETIALDLGVPASWVATIREVAYGPVRSQRSEVQKVRDVITSLGKQLTDASLRLAALERAVNGPLARSGGS